MTETTSAPGRSCFLCKSLNLCGQPCVGSLTLCSPLSIGLITICVGAIGKSCSVDVRHRPVLTSSATVILLLPDNPMSSRLSHAEKVAAVERLRENQTGIENKVCHLPCVSPPKMLTDCAPALQAVSSPSACERSASLASGPDHDRCVYPQWCSRKLPKHTHQLFWLYRLRNDSFADSGRSYRSHQCSHSYQHCWEVQCTRA